MKFQVTTTFSVMVDDEGVTTKDQAEELARDWIAESQDDSNGSCEVLTEAEADEAGQLEKVRAQAPELLKMVKAANHACFVANSSRAMRKALDGSVALIRLAEGKA